jgi:hypothetical protein
MIGSWFLWLAVFLGLLGGALGIALGISMFLASLLFRGNWTARTRLAALHLGLAVTAGTALAIGLMGLLMARAWAGPVVAIGASAMIAAMSLFAINILRRARAASLISRR